MASIADVIYFLKMGQVPRNCENVCDAWQIWLLYVPWLMTKKIAPKINCDPTSSIDVT